MLRIKSVAPLLAIVFATLLGGCYQSPDVAIHEPGVYKGSTDPLLKQPAAQRDDTLRKRFQLVQVDR